MNPFDDGPGVDGDEHECNIDLCGVGLTGEDGFGEAEA